MNLRQTELSSMKEERVKYQLKVEKRKKKADKKAEREARRQRVLAERARLGNEEFDRRTKNRESYYNFATDGLEDITPKGGYSL